MLYKLRYLNLQFNLIPAFHRANFLSLSVKREIGTVFFITEKVIPMERWGVILMRGMIALLTVIKVI